MRSAFRFSPRAATALGALLLGLAGCKVTMHEKGASQVIVQGSYGDPRQDDPLWWIGSGDAESKGVGVQYNYFVGNNLAVSGVLTPYRLYNQNGDVSSWELQAGIRWFFAEFPVGRNPMSLYLDVLVGRMHADEPVPPLGSTTNWTQDTGIGLEYALSGSWSLVGGYHLRHLSNGSGNGVTEDDNPSQNDDLWFFGVGFRW